MKIEKLMGAYIVHPDGKREKRFETGVLFLELLGTLQKGTKVYVYCYGEKAVSRGRELGRETHEPRFLSRIRI